MPRGAVMMSQRGVVQPIGQGIPSLRTRQILVVRLLQTQHIHRKHEQVIKASVNLDTHSFIRSFV